MTPDVVRAWQRVFRDFLISGIGAFMLIWGTTNARSLSPPILALVLGGGLTACGLPPLLRLDEWFRSDRDEGKP